MERQQSLHRSVSNQAPTSYGYWSWFLILRYESILNVCVVTFWVLTPCSLVRGYHKSGRIFFILRSHATQNIQKGRCLLSAHRNLSYNSTKQQRHLVALASISVCQVTERVCSGARLAKNVSASPSALGFIFVLQPRSLAKSASER
jgi:hypothetical protein